MNLRRIWIGWAVLALCLALSAMVFAQGNSENARNHDKPGVGNSTGWIPPGQNRTNNSEGSSIPGGLLSGGAMVNLLMAGGGPYLDHNNIYIITRESCKIVDPLKKSDGAWILSIFPGAGGTSTKVELKPDILSAPVFTSTGWMVFAGYDRSEAADLDSLLSNLEAVLQGKKFGGSTLYLLNPASPDKVPEVFFEGEWITGLAVANGKMYVVTKYGTDENVVNPGQNSNSIHCRIQENLYIVDVAAPVKPSPIPLP